MMNKKSQLAEFAHTWIVGLAIIFFIIIFSMIWFEPWQMVDHILTPKIDNSYQANGQYVEDLPKQFRRNQVVIPIIFLGGMIIYLVLASMKQDPNVPYE